MAPYLNDEFAGEIEERHHAAPVESAVCKHFRRNPEENLARGEAINLRDHPAGGVGRAEVSGSQWGARMRVMGSEGTNGERG